eukprot:Em0018g799a
MALCFEEVRVNKVTVVINPAYNNWAMGAVNVQGQPVSIPMDMMTFHYERNEIAAFWSDSADSTRTSLDELSMTGDFGSRIFNKTAKKHVKFPTPKTMPAYNDKAVGHTPLTGIPSIKGKWVSTASFDQADYGFLDINIHHNYNAKEAGADTGSAICMYTVQVFWDVTFRKQTSLSILSRLFDYEDLCTDLYTDVIAVEEFKDKVGSLIANAAKSGDVRQVTKVDAIVGEGVLTTADKLLLQQRGKHARLSRPGAEVAHKERIHMKHVLKRFIKQADQWEFERARDKAEYKKLRDAKMQISPLLLTGLKEGQCCVIALDRLKLALQATDTDILQWSSAIPPAGDIWQADSKGTGKEETIGSLNKLSNMSAKKDATRLLQVMEGETQEVVQAQVATALTSDPFLKLPVVKTPVAQLKMETYLDKLLQQVDLMMDLTPGFNPLGRPNSVLELETYATHQESTLRALLKDPELNFQNAHQYAIQSTQYSLAQMYTIQVRALEVLRKRNKSRPLSTPELQQNSLAKDIEEMKKLFVAKKMGEQPKWQLLKYQKLTAERDQMVYAAKKMSAKRQAEEELVQAEIKKMNLLLENDPELHNLDEFMEQTTSPPCCSRSSILSSISQTALQNQLVS